MTRIYYGVERPADFHTYPPTHYPPPRRWDVYIRVIPVTAVYLQRTLNGQTRLPFLHHRTTSRHCTLDELYPFPHVTPLPHLPGSISPVRHRVGAVHTYLTPPFAFTHCAAVAWTTFRDTPPWAVVVHDVWCLSGYLPTYFVLPFIQFGTDSFGGLHCQLWFTTTCLRAFPGGLTTASPTHHPPTGDVALGLEHCLRMTR